MEKALEAGKGKDSFPMFLPIVRGRVKNRILFRVINITNCPVFGKNSYTLGFISVMSSIAGKAWGQIPREGTLIAKGKAIDGIRVAGPIVLDLIFNWIKKNARKRNFEESA